MGFCNFTSHIRCGRPRRKSWGEQMVLADRNGCQKMVRSLAKESSSMRCWLGGAGSTMACSRTHVSLWKRKTAWRPAARQDDDGGVWHKQTSEHFSGFIAPEDDKLPSEVIGTGSAPYKS